MKLDKNTHFSNNNGSKWITVNQIAKNLLWKNHFEKATLYESSWTSHFEKNKTFWNILNENIYLFNSIKISRNLRLTFNLVSSYCKSSIYYFQIDVIRHIDIFFPLSRLHVCTPTRNHYTSGKNLECLEIDIFELKMIKKRSLELFILKFSKMDRQI